MGVEAEHEETKEKLSVEVEASSIADYDDSILSSTVMFSYLPERAIFDRIFEWLDDNYIKPPKVNPKKWKMTYHTRDEVDPRNCKV